MEKHIPDKLWQEMISVLWFYGNPKNHITSSTGFAAQYDPEPTPVEDDGGEMAMRLYLRLKELE